MPGLFEVALVVIAKIPSELFGILSRILGFKIGVSVLVDFFVLFYTRVEFFIEFVFFSRGGMGCPSPRRAVKRIGFFRLGGDVFFFRN